MLALKPEDMVIDGTLGGAGHAQEIMRRIGPGGTFLGIDRDMQAIENFKVEVPGVRVITLQANYAQLPEILEKLELPKADALLLDLGFSSDQLQGRGLSFQTDEPLLMTYDDQTPSLYDQLKGISEPKLIQILREYGEERYAKQIAKSIFERVRGGKMQTTQDLVAAVQAAAPQGSEHGRIHPATRTFQALRIYANRELEHLKSILENLYSVLKPGGRVVIISFHSLEDRIVKNYFREYARGYRHSAGTGELPNTGVHKSTASILTKKPMTASREELARNARARSAKLRALQL